MIIKDDGNVLLFCFSPFFPLKERARALFKEGVSVETAFAFSTSTPKGRDLLSTNPPTTIYSNTRGRREEKIDKNTNHQPPHIVDNASGTSGSVE